VGCVRHDGQTASQITPCERWWGGRWENEAVGLTNQDRQLKEEITNIHHFPL